MKLFKIELKSQKKVHSPPIKVRALSPVSTYSVRP